MFVSNEPSSTRYRSNPDHPDDESAVNTGLVGKGIVKKFRRHTVCNNISINVQRGEIVGLLGPNGAGKTTLFNILVGIEHPSEGQIFLNNKDITRFPIHIRARQGIGYLPQGSSIFRAMSVEDNLLAVLEFLPLNRHERNQKLEEGLNQFQLGHIRKNIANSLSGGEKRRLEIARTCLLNIHLFLLDEPFAAMDPISVHDLRHLLRNMRAQGLGLLISDHNVRETLKIVDRAYVINAGSILFHGRPNDLVNNPEVRRFYLGEQFDFPSTEKSKSP